ncbi:nucleolar RNA helicase 2-like isoform X3 [Xenia sp. Carnegie-2017]|uniref:nucleolar RNA helicase 2-like isoform X3 n=1 Tax=Xenia sp. Carnegie-2017 TaxID=2897299 RepID=UPI001F041DEC|nr:nucleolar RNA helicase 2-like isoform X3 [Xenia sp. Carnegie-2017]
MGDNSSPHRGMPYCNMPCYSLLFGPGGYGRGGVESHQKLGHQSSLTSDQLALRKELQPKLQVYNNYYEGDKKKALQLSSKEANGKLIIEGVLRIYWGLKNHVTLAPLYMKNGAALKLFHVQNSKSSKSETMKNRNTSSLGDAKVSYTLGRMPSKPLSNSEPCDEKLARRHTVSSTDRRKRLAKMSLQPTRFIPTYGTSTNLRLTSKICTPDVVKMILTKFQITDPVDKFSLFVKYENGEIKRLGNKDGPLMVRLRLGPAEDIAKIFIMEDMEENTVGRENKKESKKRKAEEDIDGERAKKVKCKSKEEIEVGISEKEGKLKKFRISKKTRKVLKERGIKFLFPIQAKTYDLIYDGHDVIGKARTGTGKTLAFALPVIELLQQSETSSLKRRPPMVLVMVPTRELAKQVNDEFEALKSSLCVHCIYGGMPYAPQESAINSGLDILIGTPGRILDHMKRGNLDLSKLKHCILDEVDRMLDMGFQDSVEEILSGSYTSDSSQKPQTLFFSATLPPWVQTTARKYMTKDRHLIDVIGNEKQQAAITVEHKAIKCPYHERASTIGDVIQVYCGAHGRTIVFTQTKKEANELVLDSILKQEAQVLHGDIQQKQRELTLKGFREGKFRCLVATDVAARGLDIPEVDLVVQCEPPKDVDAYIHRSGRTGRAQRRGVCIIFYKHNQEGLLQMVEHKAGIKFTRIGAPQPEDIIKSSAEDAKRFLAQVPRDALVFFREAAEALIVERGAVDAVAAALAHISGTTEVQSRSLLCSEKGYTTYILKQEKMELRSTSYMWRVIENNLSSKIKAEVKGMSMLLDRYGVVFDVPSSFDDEIEASWTKPRGITIEKAKELPELIARTRNISNVGRFNSNGFRSNSYYGRFNYNHGDRNDWRNGNDTRNFQQNGKK